LALLILRQEKRDFLKKYGVGNMDPVHPKAQEHREFLAAASEERARLAAQ
jgi:hypothetical protein